MNQHSQDLRQRIEICLEGLNLPSKPKNLYEPLKYFLSLGGKRMRPVLALLAQGIYTPPGEKEVKVATAIELFHNFTLLHDDIMDDAPLRRGKQTVHEKWDPNIGILSGDALFVKSYQLLGEADEGFREIFEKFNTTALEVCEGQQLDMDFESMEDPTTNDYLNMIRLKTAVLLGFSLWLGGKLGKANPRDLDLLYKIGTEVGTAFQIMDDYLDVFGDPGSFGKQPGGDILAGKKTILWMISIENSSEQSKNRLMEIYSLDERFKDHVEEVSAIFTGSQVEQEVEKMMEERFNLVSEMIEELEGNEEGKAELKAYLQVLAQRKI